MLSVEELSDKLIELAFSEGVGGGDHATLYYIPADARGESGLLVKEEEVLTEVNVARRVFHLFGPELQVEVYVEDGSYMKPGDIVMSVKGRTQSPLQAKRPMLDILQRTSGIAAMTHKCQQALVDTGTKTRVLDTRKTTPGMRMLEKEAVKIGGGMGRRINLFDIILLKDNHVDFCSGVYNAIFIAKRYCKDYGRGDLKIEYEARSFIELEGALGEGCNHIMSDSFIPEGTRKAAKMVAGRCETESSGGVTFDTITPHARAGVSFISFDALTHSAKGLNTSFKAVVLKD